jgi:hypothetical protein
MGSPFRYNVGAIGPRVEERRMRFLILRLSEVRPCLGIELFCLLLSTISIING